MTRRVAASLAVAAAALAAGCSSVSVATDYDESADFGSMRTYAWMAHAPGEPPPFAGNTIVEKRVTGAVERELGARGFFRDDASPTFLVVTHTVTREHTDVTTWPSSWGYGWHGRHGHSWGWDEHVEVTQYTEGTLVLDFVRPGSQDLLWRGVARAVVDENTGSQAFVDEVVGKLLADFPPGHAAK
jgi:hypothetical protein